MDRWIEEVMTRAHMKNMTKGKTRGRGGKKNPQW